MALTEKAKEKRRARYAANREQEIESNRSYRQARKERTAELQRLRYAANKEKARERVYAYRRKRPEYNRADQARRRSKDGGTWSRDDVERLMRRQRHKCAHPFCRASLKDGYHIDHIMPVALGGGNGPRNLQLLCVSCNQSKGARHPIDFAQMNGLLL